MATTLKDYLGYARDFNLVPVSREVISDLETPVAVLRRFVSRRNAFLLESVEGGETWGRYSFIGVDPEILFEVDHRRSAPGGLLDGLRSIYRDVKPAPAPGLPRFIGGGVGFISYEAVGEFERLPPPKPGGRRADCASRFLRVDKLIVFDNLRHTLQIVVCSRPQAAPSPEDAFRQAQREIDQIEEVLRQPVVIPRQSKDTAGPEALALPIAIHSEQGRAAASLLASAELALGARIARLAESAKRAKSRQGRKVSLKAGPLAKPGPRRPDFILPQFKSNLSPDQFCAMVAKTREYIIAGDIIQAVLSQRFTAATALPPLEIYRALRLLNPSPYMFFLKIGGQVLVGSSPETMVRLTGNRVELRPIAGTRPRGKDEQEDRRLADELLSDEKEKAEHVMLVDLGRNDIGRVAETGSVQVRDYMIIERYSHVMHIVSHVEGILRRECDAADVLKATFPAGTLSGAPKIRAMEVIRELEPDPRGVYGGAVGYVGYDGGMDFAITIRTIEALNNVVSIQAGAGIVYNSDPRREYEETCHKAQALKAAVALAANGLRLEG